MKKITLRRAFAMLLLQAALVRAGEEPNLERAGQLVSSVVLSLDGEQWLLATDPANVGRERNWIREPRSDARPTKVPWIIQEAFPGYHGVAWYWREFDAPANPHAGGRVPAAVLGGGLHGRSLAERCPCRRARRRETPFVLDVTDTLRGREESARRPRAQPDARAH